jgi:hypothetical protein
MPDNFTREIPLKSLFPANIRSKFLLRAQSQRGLSLDSASPSDHDQILFSPLRRGLHLSRSENMKQISCDAQKKPGNATYECHQTLFLLFYLLFLSDRLLTDFLPESDVAQRTEFALGVGNCGLYFARKGQWIRWDHEFLRQNLNGFRSDGKIRHDESCHRIVCWPSSVYRSDRRWSDDHNLREERFMSKIPIGQRTDVRQCRSTTPCARTIAIWM